MDVLENNEVKPHRITVTRWIAHELLTLNNSIDKNRVYVQHIDNISAYMYKKQTKLPSLEKIIL